VVAALRAWEGLRDPKLHSLASDDVQCLRDSDGLPVWVACFGAPKTLERAPIVWIKHQAGFLDLGSEPVSELLYSGRVGYETAAGLCVELRGFDVLAHE
jgi:hypothetical protein